MVVILPKIFRKFMERYIKGKVLSTVMAFEKLRMDASLWLIFGSAFVLLVWVILKVLGIINTPPLITAIPYFAGIASISGIGLALSKLLVKLGKVLERLDIFERDMGDVKGDIRRLERDMSYVKGKLRIAA